MSILTAFLVNSLSIVIGTFFGNLGLLWIIGRKAKALEQENIKRFEEMRAAAFQRIQEEVKKKQEYIKMES